MLNRSTVFTLISNQTYQPSISGSNCLLNPVNADHKVSCWALLRESLFKGSEVNRSCMADCPSKGGCFGMQLSRQYGGRGMAEYHWHLTIHICWEEEISLLIQGLPEMQLLCSFSDTKAQTLESHCHNRPEVSTQHRGHRVKYRSAKMDCRHCTAELSFCPTTNCKWKYKNLQQVAFLYKPLFSFSRLSHMHCNFMF